MIETTSDTYNERALPTRHRVVTSANWPKMRAASTPLSCACVRVCVSVARLAFQFECNNGLRVTKIAFSLTSERFGDFPHINSLNKSFHVNCHCRRLEEKTSLLSAARYDLFEFRFFSFFQVLAI